MESETFHNWFHEWSNGNGMLAYPGKQVDQFEEHSLGLDGVIPSIRLKNLRRGIQDAGYYQLATEINSEKADAFVKELVDPVLSNTKNGIAPSWGILGERFYILRESLVQIITNKNAVTKNGSCN